MAVEGDGPRAKRTRLLRHASVLQWRAGRLDVTLRGLLWSATAGLVFVLLNTVMRQLTLDLHPFQTQFLRYVFGLLVMLPFIARAGLASYRPHNLGGQFVRGGVHSIGLVLWFAAIPHITIADTTAIGFTTPIFIMLGAAWAFGEKMRWERWLAALIGLAGVLIVVAPKLAGSGGIYTLVMLASSPVFAASFLLTKGLTRYERATVIVVWQSIAVSLFSMPLALTVWKMPGAAHWFGFLLCGVLGSLGHYCLTRSFTIADISATQSVKFLDLVWATVMGWLVFADHPNRSTIIGGVVICASTLWIARREARTTARIA
ncbi:MAG TPA: DMT family transporter [Ramlibacter sp.]|nr:DMT family transporter [Ramlibacter sp.]